MKTVTLGMFTVGFLILTARVGWWYFKSKSRDWKDLGPFAMSATAFAAAGACVGGIIGTVMHWSREKVGAVGDMALTKGTGAEQVEISRPAEFGTLNPYGAVIMLGMIVLFVVVFKAAKRKPKRELTWGAPAGLTLGPFLGAITLVPLINWMGTSTIGQFFQQ
ncbi:hypothetical protein ACFWBV_34830 [Streptomyces sp. NPDC060030]|uniref:hypothetical protein n=1 Tax=Streptomyces sp. NPDC060030 TaxID=3347042 RepID=UPI0036B260E8